MQQYSNLFMYYEISEITHTSIIITICDFKILALAGLLYLLTRLKCKEMLLASGTNNNHHVSEMVTPTGL